MDLEMRRLVAVLPAILVDDLSFKHAIIRDWHREASVQWCIWMSEHNTHNRLVKQKLILTFNTTAVKYAMPVILKVYANEDDALLFWAVQRAIPECRGFAIERKIKRRDSEE